MIAMSIPLTNTEFKSKSSRGFDKRVASFLTDIKKILADGGWHHIGTTEICSVHNVGNDLMTSLLRMKCIERRRPSGFKGTGHYYEYRRTANLNFLTAETLTVNVREARREYLVRHANKQQGEPTIVDTMTTPASEPAPPSEPETTPVDQPEDTPEKKIPEHYILMLNKRLVDEVFKTEQEYVDYINANAKQDQEWIVCSIVASFKTKVSIDKII